MPEPKELPDHLKKSRRSKVAHLAAEYGTIEKIPPTFIFSRTEDGKSICLLDGTHVSNESLKSALDEALADPEVDAELVALVQAGTSRAPKQGGSAKQG
jgi:hypothetical protein